MEGYDTAFAHVGGWYKETEFCQKNSVSLNCPTLSFNMNYRFFSSARPIFRIAAPDGYSHGLPEGSRSF